jgi:hypothetical protein
MQSATEQSYDQNIATFINSLKHHQRITFTALNSAGLPTSEEQYSRLTHLIDNLSIAEDTLPGLADSTSLKILMKLLPPIQLKDLSRPNPQGDRAITRGDAGSGDTIDQGYKDKTGGFNSLSTFANFAHRAITIKTVYEHLPAHMQKQESLAFCKALGDDAETIRIYFQKPLNQVANAIWTIHSLQTALPSQDRNQISMIMSEEIARIARTTTDLPENETREKTLNEIFQAISDKGFWSSCYDLLQPSPESQKLATQTKQDHQALKKLSAKDAYESIKPQVNTLLSSIKQQDEIPSAVIIENLPLLLAITSYMSSHPETDLAQRFKTALNTPLQDSANETAETQEESYASSEEDSEVDELYLQPTDGTSSPSHSDGEGLAHTFSAQCLVSTAGPAETAVMFPNRRPASAPALMQPFSISSSMEDLLGCFDWDALSETDTPPVIDHSAITDHSGLSTFASSDSLNYSRYNSLAELNNMAASAAENDLSGATDPELSAISHDASEENIDATQDSRATPTNQPITTPVSIVDSPKTPTDQLQATAPTSCSGAARVYSGNNPNLQFPSFPDSASSTADSKTAKRQREFEGISGPPENKSPRDETNNQQPPTSRSTLVT